jgi:lipid-A-disaccharide synthase
MVVVIPTQQIDAMRAWDGLPGLFARLPLVGTWFVKAFNHFIVQRALKKNILYAWPNMWAKRRIVPELLGRLTVSQVSHLMLDYLDHPEQLEQMRQDLQQCRGEAGAARKVAQAIASLLDSGKISDIR